MKFFRSKFLLIVCILGCERLQNKFEPQIKGQTNYGVIDYDWSVRSLTGEKINFDKFQSKTIFLNFWATWCAPCLLELPSIQRLYDSLKTRDVDFVLLTSEKSADVQEFLKEKQLDVPVYIIDSRPPLTLRPEALPMTFVIDTTGNIIYKHRGFALYGELFLKTIRDVSNPRARREKKEDS